MRYLSIGARPLAARSVGRPHTLHLLTLIGLTIAVLCGVIFLSPTAPVQAAQEIPGWIVKAALPGKPSPPVITSTAAFMIDADSEEYLFSHNANARLPMASTTKIMTAILALESLDLDAEVTVSANAVGTIGSKSRLVRGEVLTVRQLLYALMVVSGNDASIALAETTSGSVSAFVEKMNARAEELGLTNTHFVNPCGLHNQRHFSSAKDLAFLAQYALENPVFSTIVDTIYFSLPPLPPDSPGGQEVRRDFDNQNELLKRRTWVTGVKTGSTPYAKYCLVASGTFEGINLIAVVLGAQEDEIRWKEAQDLLEYGFSLYPRTVLCDTGQVIADLDVSDYLGRKVGVATDRAFVARLPRDTIVECRPRLNGDVTLPVRAGQVLGTLDFTVGGQDLGSVNLVAAYALEPPELGAILNQLRRYYPVQLRASVRG